MIYQDDNPDDDSSDLDGSLEALLAGAEQRADEPEVVTWGVAKDEADPTTRHDELDPPADDALFSRQESEQPSEQEYRRQAARAERRAAAAARLKLTASEPTLSADVGHVAHPAIPKVRHNSD